MNLEIRAANMVLRFVHDFRSIQVFQSPFVTLANHLVQLRQSGSVGDSGPRDSADFIQRPLVLLPFIDSLIRIWC